MNTIDYQAKQQEMRDLADSDRIQQVMGMLGDRVETDGRQFKIVDVGCFDGFLARSIRDRFPDTALTLIGINDQAIIPNHYDSLDRFLECRVEEIGNHAAHLRDADVVFIGELIEHVYDPDALIEAALQILRPGGALILTTPNLASWFNRLLLLFGHQPGSTEVSTRDVTYGRRWVYRFVPPQQPAGHIRVFTLGALRDLLAAHGLVDVRMSGTYYTDFWLNRIISRNWVSMGEGLVCLATKP